MNAPRILLADANEFFVAVARSVDPTGAGATPLLIVGGRPGSRGVVCSASYETRAFGVRSGMPISQALRLCPNATCVPVPRAACADRSRAIRRVLERFTPGVEGASIDEWYLDLTGTEALYQQEPLAHTARRIRDAVKEETGMLVSIGGGANKLIAKLAAERAKPSRSPAAEGVWVVSTGEELAFMAEVALAEIPGIGPKLQSKLATLGLEHSRDVLAHDLATLTRWIGSGTAAWLADRARGISHSMVEPRAPAKQVSREETFDRDISDNTALAAELRHLAAKVGADLRHDALATRTITVKLRTSDFKTRTAGRTLAEAVESDRAIEDVAVDLLQKLRGEAKRPARLVGVAASNLTRGRDAEQLSMFSPRASNSAKSRTSGTGPPGTETERDRDLSRAVDRVRERFGDSAIRSGHPRGTPVGEKGARKPRD